MTVIDFKEKINSIDPSKECLNFLLNRVLSDNYRGIQISQHNRYTVDFVIVMLEELYSLVGTDKMTIRNTDLRKRPTNTPEEKTYAIYTDRVAKKLGRGTQDSIRKNHFVDYHRMGLIERYGKKGEKVSPYGKSNVRYISLTETGLQLINNKNDTFQKNLIYTRAIDILCRGLVSDLHDVLLSLKNSKISIFEFMFFLSFIGQTLDGHSYTKSELTEYVNEYRRLSRLQRDAVVDIVADYCTPRGFSGDKLNKRDFGNWKNEAQQIFMLLDQTALFERSSDKSTLSTKVKKGAIFEDEVKLLRSKTVKDDYFKNHKNIKKTIGYELHHIIPLLIAETRDEFNALDVWENLIYIDGYTHNKISHQGNKHIVLEFICNDLNLRDRAGLLDDIFCEKDKNALYDVTNQSIMKEFNSNTLHSL